MNTKSTFIFEQSTDCSNKKNVTLRKDFTAIKRQIYPTVIRDVGSGMSGIFGCFITFGIITISPLMIDKLGIPLTFSMYAVIVFVGSIILYFIMPETNNITLQQIEDKIMNEAHTNLINCELKMKEFS
ncbi:hypothetical protein PGB90_006998 [Kerria lacca]